MQKSARAVNSSRGATAELGRRSIFRFGNSRRRAPSVPVRGAVHVAQALVPNIYILYRHSRLPCLTQPLMKKQQQQQLRLRGAPPSYICWFAPPART